MPEIPDGSNKQIVRGQERASNNPLSNLLRRIRSARQLGRAKNVQPPARENLAPFAIEPGKSIDQLYEELNKHEARPADKSELIRIVGMNQDQPEFSRLESLGIDSSTLETGRVTRGALLDAGYVFLNRIGGGEKPLINAQVPMDVEGGTDIVDMSNKILLTQSELDAVIQYQQGQHGAYATESSDIDLIRKDMLLFLQQAIVEQNSLRQNSSAVFRAAQRRILDNPKYTDKDREALRQFLEEQYQEYQKKGNSNLGYIMQECIAGIDLARVRGSPFEIFATRLSALKGVPSPFLDSGFHFDINYDVTLYPHDPAQTRRLNMAVVHLLSRGLNEMGESANRSHDQRYITAGEYEKGVYQKSETTEPVSDEDLDKIASRLLFRAKKEV